MRHRRDAAAAQRVSCSGEFCGGYARLSICGLCAMPPGMPRYGFRSSALVWQLPSQRSIAKKESGYDVHQCPQLPRGEEGRRVTLSHAV
jgi:hypothetical protein